MINSYLKYKTKEIKYSPPNVEDINNSNKILFSIFTRYGDTIIDLVVIKEFIKCYPDKKYLILCPRQMKPYVNELLPDIECLTINKRNLFDMIRADKLLKKRRFDIGFNPWSNGLDSCYFLTYCKKFICYKDFVKPDNINNYQIVRKYLQLSEKDWLIEEQSLKDDYQKILICPQSTDIDRSISAFQLNKLLLDLKKKYKTVEITIASMDKMYFRNGYNQFLFEKSAQSSQNFLDLVKQSELVICSDSGPMHIANALKKTVIAVLNKTKPEIVINTGEILSLDLKVLQ